MKQEWEIKETRVGNERTKTGRCKIQDWEIKETRVGDARSKTGRCKIQD